MEEIPEELTSTELPQKWGKPRSKKVQSECLLDVALYSPSEKHPKKDPITCSLKQNPCNSSNIVSKETLQRAQNELITENPNIAMAYLLSAGVSNTNLVALPLGLMAQKNSVLHIQLGASKFGEDSSRVIDDDNATMSSLYREFPIICEQTQTIFQGTGVLPPDEMQITYREAVELEKQTRAQRKCPMWITQRAKRFTASNFGEIFHRKIRPNGKFLSRIVDAKNLNHVPSVQHGINNEIIAKNEYKKRYTHVTIHAWFGG